METSAVDAHVVQFRLLTDLQQTLQDAGAFASAESESPIHVAYSGGLDSTVLLLCVQRLLQARQQAQRLHAVHIHHGWTASDTFAQHTHQFCAQQNISLTIIPVDAAPQSGEGREAAARKARRAAFKQALGPNEFLLVAQHQDDQAETLMLRLLRGSGVEALAGMEARTPLGRGWLLRPWLQQTRADLYAWALQQQQTSGQGIRWIEDPSNADLSLDRNYLRHTVLPLLEARWPGAAQRLGLVAQHAADTREVLQQHFAQWLAAWETDLGAERLPLAALRALDAPAQGLLLRAAARMRGVTLPGGKRLQEAIAQFLHADPSRQPVLSWQDPEAGVTELRRYRDHLYWLQPATEQPIGLPERRTWQPREAVRALPLGQGIAPSWLTEPDWSLGRWMANARMRVALNRPSKRLRNLLQEAGIPPWQRAQLACLWHGERLVAVDSLWIDPEYRAKPEESGWIPQCTVGFH
jgi:tRNA(Ile)-lysidine synthase